jgi:hypothetical protein
MEFTEFFTKILLEAVPKLQFWNSNPGFKGKSGAFDRFFQELVSKPTGFWNKLT